MIFVVTLYEFVRIETPSLMKERLRDWIAEQDIKGTLIIAPEGVNGTLSGQRANLEELLAYLAQLLGAEALSTKWSTSATHPFRRLKFPLKDEIVTMGKPRPDPTQQVGTYVEPNQWNELISDPEVTVVDTRNAYEVDLGTFKGAIDPGTAAFSDFEAWVRSNLDPTRNKKVAMFCTGGIRCEKASSFLMAEGFESVFHLKGGILSYLENVQEQSSLWQGECFVFDERVTLTHGLKVGEAVMCKACGRPTKEGKLIDAIVVCPACHEPLLPKKIPEADSTPH